MNNPYKLSDKAIAVLNKRLVKRFQKAKEQSAKLKFDELNVLDSVKTLYRELEKDNEEIFLQLARNRYQELNPESEKKLSKHWLIALLDEVDPVTRYIYTNEILRKRDYLIESVNGSIIAKNAQYIRGMKLWSGMTAQYADTIEDAASLEAYEDMGYTKVKWVTQADDKVCEECRERNGKIYPIRDIPPKPHWRCRCYYVPSDQGNDRQN